MTLSLNNCSYVLMTLSGVTLPPYRLVYRFFITGKALSYRVCRQSYSVNLNIPFGITDCSLLAVVVTRIYKLRPKRFVRYVKSARICSGRIRTLLRRYSHGPHPFPGLVVGRSQGRRVGYVRSFGTSSFRLIKCGPRTGVCVGVTI